MPARRWLLTLLLVVPCLPAQVLDLSGTWRFRLDPDRIGMVEGLPDSIRLPGSTDEAGFGTKDPKTETFAHLHRKWEYVGPAWYERDIDVPAGFRGKRVSLFLERCHWETRAWLDGKPLGMRDSLCTPHVYDLGTTLAPGRHRLAIRVDNSIKFNVGGWAHSITDETQTNWNGIVGRLELRADDPVWIAEAQAYPDLAARALRLKITVGNATGKPVSGTLAGAAFTCPGASAQVETTVPVPADLKPYDEFSRAAASTKVDLTAGAYRDQAVVPYGLRRFEVKDKRLTLNGRPHFLRGTLECCIFPRTGYPATDLASWRRIMATCRDYGLNHLRFHSWCPPDAAFAAADEQGFLLQIELPQWVGNCGKEPPRDTFITEELRRIVATYGNHPSFGMLCMGNELGGEVSFLDGLVKLGKELDPRHLYTTATAWSHGPSDDYSVSVVRGLRGPKTDHDFRADDAKDTVPTISHEIGQWMVFPNLAEIPKYTGPLAPRNFEAVRDQMAKNGLLDQADTFVQSSGRLSALLYKEEMEVLLRTPGHGGFQLLDLHDFPGQWTSLVGILDAFWDSKGIITPAEWRRFCSPSVPLLRLTKRVYSNQDTLTAAAEIAHFGPSDLKAAKATWRAVDDAGHVVGQGAFEPRDLPTGELSPLGTVTLDLKPVREPTRLRLEVAVPEAGAANDWNVWVYPMVESDKPSDAVFATTWEEAKTGLAAGRKVLLMAGGCLREPVTTRFEVPFWNPLMFKGQPHTFGQVIDPKHPALALFPTELHNDWQWTDVLSGARSMVIDTLPRELKPIIASIDCLDSNRPLANVLEAKVGEGRLLVVTYDLRRNLEKRPAAQALRRSLLAYMAGPAFAPRAALTTAQLETVFGPNLLTVVPGAPTEGLQLSVRAAVNNPQKGTNFDWEPKLDKVERREAGFDYKLTQGATWLDETGSSWHHNDEVKLQVTCPKGFAGRLYLFLWDWNANNRAAAIRFEGRTLGTLDEYDGAGKWVMIPVTAADSADGVLDIAAQAQAGNVMVSALSLSSDTAPAK